MFERFEFTNRILIFFFSKTELGSGFRKIHSKAFQFLEDPLLDSGELYGILDNGFCVPLLKTRIFQCITKHTTWQLEIHFSFLTSRISSVEEAQSRIQNECSLLYYKGNQS